MKNRHFTFGSLCAAIALNAAAMSAANTEPSLEDGFARPPADARPFVWYHMNSGVPTRESVTADLESMARVGIGGAQVFYFSTVFKGAAEQGIFSAHFLEVWKHAAAEADRLGLELGFQNCAGWSASGGPQVPVEKSMQTLCWSETFVAAGQRFSGQLPVPLHKHDFYRDVAVLACRVPEGELPGWLANVVSMTAAPAPAGDLAALYDGRQDTMLALPLDKDGKVVATIEYDRPLRAQTLELQMPNAFESGVYRLEAADAAGAFKKVGEFKSSAHFETSDIVLNRETFVFAPVEAKRFRVTLVPGIDKSKSVTVAELRLMTGYRPENFQGAVALPGFANTCLKSNRPVPDDCVVSADGVIDLTSKMGLDGRLDWTPPGGAWVLLRMGHTTTGKENHPATKGKGFECDKMSSEAVEVFWNGGPQIMLDAVKPYLGRSVKEVVLDSVESGNQNWTPRLPEEFAARRGYALLPWLPAITGRMLGSRAMTERFYGDWLRTLGELYAEKWFGALQRKCAENGVRFCSEIKGQGPFSTIQVGKYADMPMAEIYGGVIDGKATLPSHPYSQSKVGRPYGRRFVGAETFPSGGGYIGFSEHPGILKPAGDRAYALGVNRFYFHTFAHQPDVKSRPPGNTLGYWGLVFTRNQTWWEPARAYFQYLARCQWMLQHGDYAADALIYVPNPMGSDGGGVKSPENFQADQTADLELLAGAKVENGEIVLPAGTRYPLLVVAGAKALASRDLAALRRLLEQGAKILVSQSPTQSADWQGDPQRDAVIAKQFAVLAKEFVGAADAPGRGRLMVGDDFGKFLPALDWKPSFAAPDALPQAPVDHWKSRPVMYAIHRRSLEADWFFVFNAAPEAGVRKCVFRVTGKEPELWNPDTGTKTPARNWKTLPDGRTEVAIPFDPWGSTFVVFLNPTKEKTVARPAPVETTLATLDGPWELRFSEGWRAPERMTLSKLASWSELEPFDAKHFSGTATYEKAFTLAKAPDASTILLDLGEVHVIAEVLVNGKPCGIAWKEPYRVDITEAVQNGENRLEIKVSNLWINRLIADATLPKEKRLTFDDSRLIERRPVLKLQPAGLLGPVTLQAISK